MSRNLPIRQYPYSTYQDRKIGKETDPNRNTRNKKKKNTKIPTCHYRIGANSNAARTHARLKFNSQPLNSEVDEDARPSPIKTILRCGSNKYVPL